MATKTKKKVRRKPSTALARVPVDNTPLGVARGLAIDKRLTVDKLAQLIALDKQLRAEQAKAEYWAAFERMRPNLPVIEKKGIIRGKSEVKGKPGPIQSRYARFEDIQRIIKPILAQFGFVSSYSTEWPALTTLCVVGRLTHVGGHFEESRFQSPADASGGKNAIQGLGSANSYGKRYTIKDLLNLEEQGVDDDGKGAGALEGQVVNEGAPPRQAPPAREYQKSTSTAPITEGQQKRLHAIAKNSARLNADVRAWLKQRYGVDRSEQIRRCDYDEIVAAIEHDGPLPVRLAGED